jgi:hypothetical protein
MIHQGNLVRSGVDSVLVSYDHTKTVNHLRHYVNALIMKITIERLFGGGNSPPVIRFVGRATLCYIKLD